MTHPLKNVSHIGYEGVAERFEKRRQDLDELLGDMSPYWNKSYEWEYDTDSDSD